MAVCLTMVQINDGLRKSQLRPKFKLTAIVPSHGHIIAIQVVGNWLTFMTGCIILWSRNFNLRLLGQFLAEPTID